MRGHFAKLPYKRPTCSRDSLILISFAVLALAVCFPLLKDLHISCRGDWDYFSFIHQVSSQTVFEYNQFPLWNPYSGGGMSLIGNPQSGFPSPIFLLTGLFGVIAGLKIAVWVHTFLGFWGMWLLAGYFRLTGSARLVCPFIFMLSSPWALHIAEGHLVWLPAALLPFLFFTFLKGLKEKRWLLYAASLESLMIYEGGTYVLAYSAIFIGVFAIINSLENMWWRPILAFAEINIIAVALAAPKVFPVIEALGRAPRPTSAGNAMSWDDCLAAFLERNGSLTSGNWETGAYLGIIVVALYVLSLSMFRQQRGLILSSIFILLLCVGNFATFSPWNILHKLPLFSSFKVPTRSLIVFCFSVALLVGLFLERGRRSKDIRVKFILWAVVLFIGADLFLLSYAILGEATKAQKVSFLGEGFKIVTIQGDLYHDAPEQTTGIGRSVASVHLPFRQTRVPELDRFIHGGWSNQYLPLLENTGIVNAYEPLQYDHNARAVTDADYKGEYYVSGAGGVKLQMWSPNKLLFHVVLPEEGRLVVNQNFSSGWHTSRGVLTSFNGLLAVKLAAGEHDIVLRYLPYSFVIGLAVFSLTVMGIAVTTVMSLAGMGNANETSILKAKR